MKCQGLFPGKNKEKYHQCAVCIFAQSVQSLTLADDISPQKIRAIFHVNNVNDS